MQLDFSDLRELLIFNIKYYRYKNNYSQERLAELSKLSPRYITDIERGLHCPTIPKLEIIAKSLNIEPYELFVNPKRDINILNKIKNSRQYNQK
ncbi:MAG: helix-turn-helix transcriptional regulator [Bacilli bacterium]|jgi:transcriptional regulator with XRE-family HTH domain|nr:helix-turn-helix transcriptional regulator [Bacilli bacterium]